jgi:hypothetical protein
MSEFKINPGKATVKGNLFKGDLINDSTITKNNANVTKDRTLTVDDKTIKTFLINYTA